MPIDDHLPHYDFLEWHEVTLKSTPQETYDTLQKVDLSDSFLIRILFFLRGMKPGTFRSLQNRFIVLSDDPPKEIILGLIGRPWELKGGILPITKEEYEIFKKPGFAKMAWSFNFEPEQNGTHVSTETRILNTDEMCRKKFGIYWFFVRPFSGWVRKEILRLMQKELAKNKKDRIL